MTAPFEVSIQEGDRGRIVQLRGELDLAVEPLFVQVLGGLSGDGHAGIRIDLSELQFIDSRGLHVLLGAWRRWTEAGRTFDIVRGPEPVMRVFEVSGVEDQLPFTDA
jgi:anti-sigma B factor antagonist